MMSAPRSEIACLMYHEVTDDPASSGFQRARSYRYNTRRADFAEHLLRFRDCGLTPEPVDSYRFAQPGRHLMLTFDDGGKSGLYAAEALTRLGWPAHFFVVTSRIGGRTFLGADELRTLRSLGHLVGTHSHTHPDISATSRATGCSANGAPAAPSWKTCSASRASPGRFPAATSRPGCTTPRPQPACPSCS